MDVGTVIAFASLAVSLSLWTSTARKPGKLRRKFLKDLLRSTPIDPQHRPAESAGPGYDSLVTDEDRLFFADFAAFAALLNRWFSERDGQCPWRLQELPETELKLSFYDSPSFGRRYEVYHNRVRLGEMEVAPAYQYAPDNPIIYADIELDWVRLLSFDQITDLLHGIAYHLCSDSIQDATSRIHVALTKLLWNDLKITGTDLDGQGTAILN